MVIFPAIDIRGGRCVRLVNGDFNKETCFSDNPMQMALKWQSMGAHFLHVVDLDGAREKQPVNLAAIKAILNEVDIPVQVGGGIRTMDSIEKMLGLGVERVILGTVAVHNPELVKKACEAYGDRIVVGIDAKDGFAEVDGWGTASNMDAVTLAKRMANIGVVNIVYTDIARDGTLAGLNIEATAELARESGAYIIASGGVHSLDDIRALKKHEPEGIEGVIIGKAIYEGRIDLTEAIKIAEEA